MRGRGGNVEFDETKPVLREKYGLVFPEDPGDPKDLMRISDSEVKALRTAFDKDVAAVRAHLADTTAHDKARRYVFAQAAKNVLNAHAGVGWSSGSHTALPTFTTAKGVGADILIGMEENSDLGIRLKRLVAE